MIEGIKVLRHGDVRRAKLYYLRQRSGRSARIAEKLGAKKKPNRANAIGKSMIKPEERLKAIVQAAQRLG